MNRIFIADDEGRIRTISAHHGLSHQFTNFRGRFAEPLELRAHDGCGSFIHRQEVLGRRNGQIDAEAGLKQRFARSGITIEALLADDILRHKAARDSALLAIFMHGVFRVAQEVEELPPPFLAQ